MIKKVIVMGIVAVSFLTSEWAVAQGREDCKGRECAGQMKHDGPQNRHHRRVRPLHHPDGPSHMNMREERDERGVGPDHEFHRGSRLPVEYRSKIYVVDNWRAHNLKAPPRGYHWVQLGADYALVAIATGIILQVVLSH